MAQGKTMSEAFLNRLKNNQLTNVDQYRRMQLSLSGIKTEDQKSADKKEEWKNWQLAPVSAGHETNDPALLDPRSEGAQGLYKAMKVLDKK